MDRHQYLHNCSNFGSLYLSEITVIRKFPGRNKIHNCKLRKSYTYICDSICARVRTFYYDMMDAEGLSMLFLKILYAKRVDSRKRNGKIYILISNKKQIAKIQ